MRKLNVWGCCAILVILLGVFLRLHRLGLHSYWYDEFFTVGVSSASSSLAEVVERAWTSDIHPPLFYVLAHYWMGLFGNHEAATRSLSALFGIAAMLFAAAYFRKWYKGISYFFLTSLFSLSYGCLYFAQEFRSYILLVFFSTIMTAVAIDIYTADAVGRRKTALLAGMGLFASLTHHYGSILLVSVLLLVLFRVRRSLRDFVFSLIAGFLALLPATVWAAVQYVVVAREGGALAGGWLRDVSKLERTASLFLQAFGDVGTLIAAGVVVLFLYETYRAKKALSPRARAALWIAASGYAIPLLISFHTPIFDAKYLMILLPSLFILVTEAFDFLHGEGVLGRAGRAALTAIPFLFIASSLYLYHSKYLSVPRKAAIKQSAEYIFKNEDCRSGYMYVAGQPEVFGLNFYEYYADRFGADTKLVDFNSPDASRYLEDVLEDSCPVLIWQIGGIRLKNEELYDELRRRGLKLAKKEFPHKSYMKEYREVEVILQ